jgi:hypothetical protein
MNKIVLLIDNEDITPKLTELKRKVKGVDFEQFNVGSVKLTEVLTDKRIDPEKVKTYFIKNFSTRKPHLICFDYELGPEDITGLDILNALKPLAGRAQFLFYSSKIKEILGKILRKYRDGGIAEDKASELLRTLITSKIEAFVGRGSELGDVINNILAKRRETLDDIFEDKIREYGNFKTDYFDCFEIRDIEQLLNEKDDLSLNFKRELVEQFVAYIIRLQDE